MYVVGFCKLLYDNALSAFSAVLCSQNRLSCAVNGKKDESFPNNFPVKVS